MFDAACILFYFTSALGLPGVRFWGKMSGCPVGQLNCPVFQLNAAYFVIKTEYQLKIAAQVVYYRSGTVVRRYTFLFA